MLGPSINVVMEMLSRASASYPRTNVLSLNIQVVAQFYFPESADCQLMPRRPPLIHKEDEGWSCILCWGSQDRLLLSSFLRDDPLNQHHLIHAPLAYGRLQANPTNLKRYCSTICCDGCFLTDGPVSSLLLEGGVG